MNDKTGNTLREHVIVAGTDSNSKLKWLDDLVEDLLKAASNIKTVMEFQNKDFKADKPCQYKEVHKKIVNFFSIDSMKIGVTTYLSISCPFSTLLSHPHFFLSSFFLSLLGYSQ